MQGLVMTLDVLQVTHYDMDKNRGVSVHYVAGQEHTNNKFGCAVVEGSVQNYNELAYLELYADRLPARFKCVATLGQKKDKNNKSVGTLMFSSFEYVESIEFVPVKVTK